MEKMIFVVVEDEQVMLATCEHRKITTYLENSIGGGTALVSNWLAVLNTHNDWLFTGKGRKVHVTMLPFFG